MAKNVRVIHQPTCATVQGFASRKSGESVKAKCDCGARQRAKYRPVNDSSGDMEALHGMSIGEGCYLRQRARVPY